MNRIVVLDGYTANPGDLSWDGLSALGDFTLYERSMPDEVVERAKDADIILTNKVLIGEKEMSQLPRLRYVGVLATGYNVVDVEAAHRRGIVVTNIPAYSTMSVAQMVFAHLLSITHHVSEYTHSVNAGNWQRSVDFCFYEEPLIELDGLKMGIVGLGNTGTAVARIAQSFGMRVMAYSSKTEQELCEKNIEKASTLEQLFRECDVLSLHCPLTPDTHHLVNAERLSLMKPSAIVINTGRGPLVDDQALANALNDGIIYAAGIDVLAQEPPRDGNPLIGARHCQITPHVAWATLSARQRLVQIAAENVAAFLRGEKVNRV